MKKVLALILGLMMLLSSAAALGEVDLTGMSLEELLKLRRDVDDAILRGNGAVILQSGDYVAGRDIAAGSYVITFYKNQSTINPGKIVVYNSEDAMKSYEADYKDYQVQIRILDSNANNGIEISMADKPEKFDYGQYYVTYISEYFQPGSTYRVNLEEGQVLHIENDGNDLYCTIEQAKTLFMN